MPRLIPRNGVPKLRRGLVPADGVVSGDVWGSRLRPRSADLRCSRRRGAAAALPLVGGAAALAMKGRPMTRGSLAVDADPGRPGRRRRRLIGTPNRQRRCRKPQQSFGAGQHVCSAFFSRPGPSANVQLANGGGATKYFSAINAHDYVTAYGLTSSTWQDSNPIRRTPRAIAQRKSATCDCSARPKTRRSILNSSQLRTRPMHLRRRTVPPVSSGMSEWSSI